MNISMKFVLKILASLLGLMVILVLAGVFWITNLDANNYKEWLQTQVENATGHSLRLNGNVEFSLYPWLTVAADDVRVLNPAGFGDEPMVAIEHLAFRARLLPLLSRNFEIESVVLHGLDAHLITNAAGASNWAVIAAESAEQSSAAAASTGMPFNDLRVGGISIERINVVMEDQRTDSRLSINELRFSSDDLVYGQPINLNLAFGVTSNSPILDASVALNGTVNYDLDNGRYDVNPLLLESEFRGAHLPGGRADVALTTALHFDLEADRFMAESLSIQAPQTTVQASIFASDLQRGSARIESSISVEGQDLAVLFRLAGIETLANQIAQLPARNLVLQTQLVAHPARGEVEVSTLQMSLLGATISGQVTAGNLNSDAPLLRGNVRASGPNLPSVMEVAGQVTGGRNSKLAEGGRLMQRLDNKRFELDADFDANLANGSVQIPVLNASLLNAQLTANLSASALNTDTPAAQGKLEASGTDLPTLLQIGSWFATGADSAAFRYASNLGQIQDRNFTAATEFDVNLRSGAINISQLSARALGQQINGNFMAANINNGNGAVNGAFTLNGSNLPALLRAIEQAELADVAQSASVELRFSGSSNDLQISPARAQLVLSGSRIPNSPVTVALDAASRVNLNRETLAIESFSLNGLGLDVRGRINASNVLSTPSIEGAIEIAQFNPRRLLTQLNQPVPVTSDPSVLQVLALNSGFAYSSSGIALTELAMRLDDTSINGGFSLSQNASLTNWELDLDIDTINVDRYLSEAEPVQNTSTDDAAMPIPVDTLRSLNGRGSLDIGNLQVAGMTLADLSVNVDARNGRINLAPLSSNLYQGSFNGNINLDASQAVPSIGVNVALQQIAIEPLLLDMMDAAMVSGRGSVQLDVRSSGADTLALRQGLTGTGNINLEDGVLRGVDVGSVLTQLETMIRSRTPGQFTRGQQTAFDSFSATLQLDNGVVNSNDLLIQSPGFQVTGRGTLLNLHDDSINYDLVTSVTSATASRNDQQYNVGGYSVPIACSGTIASPRCLPDAGEIFRVAFANEVRSQVDNLLRRATGTDQAPATSADQGTTTQQDPGRELINRALDRLLPN